MSTVAQPTEVLPPSESRPASAAWGSRLARLKPFVLRAPAAASDARNGEDTFRLLRYFSLLGAMVFMLAGTVFVSVYSWHQQHLMQELSRDRNVALVQVLAKTIWINHAEYLSNVGHLNGDQLRARVETTLLDREIRTVLVGLPVLKTKIYHPNTNTLYSTESAQIGNPASLHKPDFDILVKNAKPTSKITFRESFNGVDGVVKKVYVTETYVPMVDSTGSVTAVFEIYADMTAEMAALKENTRRVATMTVILFFVLYAIMLLIVRRADTVLQNQHANLRTLNSRLEAESAKTVALNVMLEEKLVQLERSNQDLQDFAHVASHDLQEPLRKIEAFGERLAKRYASTLPEDGQMFIERMQDASQRMRKLISDLLAYSRTVNKQAPTEKTELKLVLDGVLSDLQVRIEETGAEFKIQELGSLEGDPGQLRQLLQNLIANALKFRKKDVTPVIEISSARNSAGQLEITISDNGVGFDPRLTHKLFKVFHRLHGRSEYEGSGIGLATCRKIVERHGGTIEAHGRLGEGATFRIVLPLSQTQTTHVARPAQTQPARGAANSLAEGR